MARSNFKRRAIQRQLCYAKRPYALRDVSRLSNRLTIKTDKEKHTISMGTPGKAKEVADAIMARL